MSYFSRTVIPVHSYSNYTPDALQRIHTADQWLPVLSFIYIFVVITIYGYQCCTRFHKFDPRIISIHQMGFLCLILSMAYCAFLFIESHHDEFEFVIFNSCLSIQRMHLIALVIVKLTTTLTWIFNLSYMNQSPFFNPRYKYISKKRRKFFRFLFIAFKCIIALFLPIGIFSAYQRTQYGSFVGAPNNFTYCYLTFNLDSFFFMFGTDILGVVLYALLFGRNACQLTRRKIKMHHQQPDVNPSNMMHASRYDEDDPIRQTLLINGDNVPCENMYEEDSSSEINDDLMMNRSLSSKRPRHKKSSVASISQSQSQQWIDHSRSSMRTITREASVVSGVEHNVALQEQNGVRELTRVLRLIWLMFLSYWFNVLLYVFYGLYTSSACVALAINATCILLLNDYEFSSTYWAVRSSIVRTLCCCCIGSRCGCWFGQRKYSIAHDDDAYQFCYDDDTVYSRD